MCVVRFASVVLATPFERWPRKAKARSPLEASLSEHFVNRALRQLGHQPLARVWPPEAIWRRGSRHQASDLICYSLASARCAMMAFGSRMARCLRREPASPAGPRYWPSAKLGVRDLVAPDLVRLCENAAMSFMKRRATSGGRSMGSRGNAINLRARRVLKFESVYNQCCSEVRVTRVEIPAPEAAQLAHSSKHYARQNVYNGP